MFRVTEYDDYLCVEFLSHPDLLEMERAAADEFSHPHYADKNDIWVFNENLPDVELQHFQILSQFITQIFPKKAAHSKTAVVVSSTLGVALAHIWRDSVTLPYELKVFQSLQRARQWVVSPVPAEPKRTQ